MLKENVDKIDIYLSKLLKNSDSSSATNLTIIAEFAKDSKKKYIEHYKKQILKQGQKDFLLYNNFFPWNKFQKLC